MVYGWAGIVLYIDLTEGKIVKKSSDKYVKTFLGGRGVNAKLLFDEAKPNTSPYDPEAPLIFGAGALAGTGLIGTSRMEVTGISPAKTEEYSLGNVGMGGTWAPELKFAGYDNVVVKGRAKEPVYIFINNDDVEIRSADAIWGRGVFATQDLIREELGDEDIQVVGIGQAGENLAVQATIEQAYRSGTAMGASMGAKKLKAVAVRGTKPVKVHNPELILKLNEKTFTLSKKREQIRGKGPSKEGKDAYDVSFLATDAGVVGDYESHAWRMRTDIKQQYEEAYLGKENYAYPWGCFGCPFPCQPIFDIPEAGGIMVWRCYPTYWPWKIWITDMKIAFEATRLMSDYGLENREIATEISWLMHLYKDGIISAKDTDGIPFDRGSKEALFQTIQKVAKREGFGAVLAEGPMAFAKKLGPKAQEYLIQSRGVTMRTFDFRLEPGTALGEAISSRGNSLRATTYHSINWGARTISEGIPGVTPEQLKANKTWAKQKFGTYETIKPFAYKGKPAALIFEMHGAAVSDSLGFCTTHSRPERFGLPGSQAGDPSYQFAAERFTAATGIPLNENGLFQIAERIVNVERAFVIRDGRTRATDTLPEFFFKIGIPDGPHKGRKLDKVKFERMKDEYYSLRGWDVQSGIPTSMKLEELGLKDVADNLKKLGKL